MFDRFGEFDSYQEINEKAAELLAAGDTEGVRALAEENGLDPEDADDYVNGDIPELTNGMLAALGKLDVERAHFRGNVKNGELLFTEMSMGDWLNYIRMECQENPDMAEAVRRKKKNLEDCIATILKWSFDHQIEIDGRIVKAAGVRSARVTTGEPGAGTAKKIIRKYYLGGRA